KRAEANITVTLPTVATVTVSPPTVSVKVGSTQALSVVLKDGSGNTLVRPVTWTSSDNLKATVSDQGVVSGLVAGTVTITATSETKTGTATVLVTSGEPPTIVDISPATITPGV